MRCSIIRFGLQDEYVGRNFFKFFKCVDNRTRTVILCHCFGRGEVQFLTGG